MPSSFPSQQFPNEYQAIPEETYFFQGARLEADHPPVDDLSNRVATTGWVKAELCGIELLPIVSKVNLLLIGVSEGTVTKPKTTTVCHVRSTVTPIGVNRNSIENVYVRYSDCSIIVTTLTLTEDEGYLLAKVTTNDVEIISIDPTSSPLGWAKLDSPSFTGDPQVPTPIITDNDFSIANTKWVNLVLNEYKEELNSNLLDYKNEIDSNLQDYKDSLNTEFNSLKEDIENQVNDLTSSVEERISNLEQSISSIAAIFTNNPNISLTDLPKVTQSESLKIQVSAGKVGLPEGVVCGGSNCANGFCNVSATSIFVVANSDGIENPEKQIWVRYSDCSIVSSESIPSTEEGFRLAEIYTNDSQITKIKDITIDINSLLGNLNAKYGGTITTTEE